MTTGTMTSSSHQKQVVVVVDLGRFNVGHGGIGILLPVSAVKRREVACELAALSDCFGFESAKS